MEQHNPNLTLARVVAHYRGKYRVKTDEQEFWAEVTGKMIYAAESGAESGFTTWAGSAYMDNGESVAGEGRGVFEKSGTNTWRVRAVLQVTGGRCC